MQPKHNSVKPGTPAVGIGGRILIVEDEYVVASDLQFILENAGYSVIGIAASVSEAQELIEAQKPDVVLLDIFLQGKQTGIDLAGQLTLAGIPFIYLSANSNQSVLEQAKATQPYGFIVKPFREKDILITLQMILYRHAHRIELRLRQEQSLQIALTDALSRDADWEDRLLEVTGLLQPHIPFDYLIMGLENDKDLDAFRSCSFYRIGHDDWPYIRQVPADPPRARLRPGSSL
jgi:AmiR/NasT family two-component response regulator